MTARVEVVPIEGGPLTRLVHRILRTRPRLATWWIRNPADARYRWAVRNAQANVGLNAIGAGYQFVVVEHAAFGVLSLVMAGVFVRSWWQLATNRPSFDVRDAALRAIVADQRRQALA